MSEYLRPLPQASEFSSVFWEKCRSHELWIQHCEECGAYVFHPRPCCPSCHGTQLEWHRASGRGRLASFSVVQQAFGKVWKDATPYIAALVQLDEGPKIATTLTGIEPSQVSLGMPVEVAFDDITEAWTLPRFRPIK